MTCRGAESLKSDNNGYYYLIVLQPSECLKCYCTVLKTSSNPIRQSDVEVKSNLDIPFFVFLLQRLWSWFVISLSSHWHLVKFCFFLTRFRNNFGFGFEALKRNPL